MSTLFAILSSLIRVYAVCHSLQSDQGLHYLPFSATDHGIHYFPFFLSSIITIYTVWHSFLAVYQGLHCFPFSAVWSVSTLSVILSSLIRVYTVSHSQQSDQGLHYFPFTVWWVTVKNSNRSPRKFEHLEQYFEIDCFFLKLIEKSREYQKPQPTHDTKRKRKMTKALHVKNKQTNAREAHRPATSSPSEVNTMLKGMTEHVLA